MTELAIEVHGPLMSALELSPTGLRLPAGLAFDTWAGLGEKIMLITQGVMWALGDWYEYGEATYGEKAAQALDSDRWSFKTFVNAGYVARRFPESSRRRDSQLTYSHYDAVAALEPDEADALLDRAEDEGLSVHQLRQEVRARRNGATVPSPRKELRDCYNLICDMMADLEAKAGALALQEPNAFALPEAVAHHRDQWIAGVGPRLEAL